jgi:hypothetical protein
MSLGRPLSSIENHIQSLLGFDSAPAPSVLMHILARSANVFLADMQEPTFSGLVFSPPVAYVLAGGDEEGL